MSDYSKIVDYAAKDSLTTGNPSKAVKGTELGAEFDSLATMSGTKADKSMTGAFLLANGAVGAPSLAFVSETNTGLYRVGAADIRFAVGGVDNLKIAAASFTAPAFIPTSSTVPTNGMCLSAANTPAIASNTVLRWSVNSTGNHVFAAPSSGVTQTVNAIGGVGINLTGTSVGDVALKVQTVTTGDPYVFIDANSGGTSWSIGSRRSDSKFVIARATGISAGALEISSSGNHVLAAPSSGATFQTTAVANGNAAFFIAPNTAGQSFGPFCQAGTTATDYGFRVQSADLTKQLFKVQGDGVNLAWEGVSNVGSAQPMPVATVESGSFTGTLTGCTTSPANTINWRRVGTLITLDMAANLLATSNSTAVTITGLPAGLSPVRLQRCATSAMEDNTATVAGYISITGGSTVLTGVRADGAAFTGSGTKGFISFTISYNLS